MFTWLKKILGIAPVEMSTPVVETVKEPAPSVEKPVAPKKTTKKSATKKTTPKVDLEGMSKKDLLAHAKANGIKSNASMNKADILAAIKKG